MTYIDLLKMNYWFWFFGGFVTAGVLVSWGLYFLYEKERKNIRSKYIKMIPSDSILRMDRNTFLLLRICKLGGLYVIDPRPKRTTLLGFNFEIIPDKVHCFDLNKGAKLPPIKRLPKPADIHSM